MTKIAQSGHTLGEEHGQAVMVHVAMLINCLPALDMSHAALTFDTLPTIHRKAFWKRVNVRPMTMDTKHLLELIFKKRTHTVCKNIR